MVMAYLATWTPMTATLMCADADGDSCDDCDPGANGSGGDTMMMARIPTVMVSVMLAIRMMTMMA